MKRIVNKLTLLALSLFGCAALSAQEAPKVPISIYLPDQVESIPVEARASLEAKLTSAAAKNGMGATPEFTQFYITAAASVVDRHVLPGAPTKYRQEVDLTFYVVDAFSKKIFGSTILSVSGVGNSESKSYIACFKQLQPSNRVLGEFLQTTNRDIINYYESQIDNIIAIAESLAKVYKYDEALFRLACFPEACPSYPRIVEVATGIYQKYIDDQARRCLEAARAIWIAGQDAAAAAACVPYLSQIMPEASCYEEAMELALEIKERVKSDIDYYRELEARDNKQNYEIEVARIRAWRDVGIAYGTNQKADIYRESWVW